VAAVLELYPFYPWAEIEANDLENGDLVSRKDKEGELYIVIGYTYRVSRHGNQRIMKLFCSITGQQTFILEKNLVIINAAKKIKKSS
jgi:hypothetical protein